MWSKWFTSNKVTTANNDHNVCLTLNFCLDTERAEFYTVLQLTIFRYFGQLGSKMWEALGKLYNESSQPRPTNFTVKVASKTANSWLLPKWFGSNSWVELLQSWVDLNVDVNKEWEQYMHSEYLCQAKFKISYCFMFVLPCSEENWAALTYFSNSTHNWNWDIMGYIKAKEPKLHWINCLLVSDWSVLCAGTGQFSWVYTSEIGKFEHQKLKPLPWRSPVQLVSGPKQNRDIYPPHRG